MAAAPRLLPAVADPAPPGPSRPNVAETDAGPAPAADVISLEPGEIRTLTTETIQRVAVGDPEVVDVTLVSLKELLLKGVAVGTTNLIIWDQRGQRVWNVEVVDHKPEALEEELRRLLGELDLPTVSVKRERGRLFFIGEVPRQEDLDQLEQMLSAYRDQITNLVTALPSTPPPAEPPKSVKLTVQVIEMTGEAKDKLGVDWMDSLTFTETAFGAVGTTASLPSRLREAFRVGALSRTGFSAVLNVLVSNGKARILAEPKLVAASGKDATTIIGVEIPIITTTSVSSGTVSQNIEFKQTGVELKFKPTVLEDEHSIQLALNAKVSSIDTTNAITVSGITVPGFRIRETKTEIVTESGEPVFISGLLQDEEKKNLSQLPGVGSIPVLGTLFRSTQFTNNQTELVVVVTPELMAQPEEPDALREQAVEQSLASAELAATAVADPTLRYALEIQGRIAGAIRYPMRGDEPRQDGRVTLRLHLFRDGTLGQAVVAESAGVAAFDTEALTVAQAQAPYPPFPSDLVQQDLWLEIPVLFRP